jgi:TetR/AcrR family transcriptional regulator, ethionamide resistance regulator
MPVLSKGSESAERRRDAEAAFLLAAEVLLADGHPYAELSVEQISAAAGRSRTAFYLYFRDKRELLMRLTEAVAATLYDEADRWWSGDDGRRDLRTALADVLGTYREHADLLRAVVEASAYDEEVAEFWRALVGRFADATERRLVAEGQEAGPAAAKALALTWMVERVSYQQIVRGASVDDPQLVDALVEIWERSVYGPG